MRPLSPEEVEQVTKSALRPLRWGLYFLVIPAAIFLIWILRSPLGEHWQSFLAPAIFFGLAFWMAWRKKAQIEADLATGFAETLTARSSSCGARSRKTKSGCPETASASGGRRFASCPKERP